MNVIGQVTVSESGDVAIPRSICEQAGLLPGMELIVEEDGAGGIWLRRKEGEAFEDITQ